MTILKEGGNIFAGTTDFDHKIIPAMMKQINSVAKQTGAKVLPIGAAGPWWNRGDTFAEQYAAHISFKTGALHIAFEHDAAQGDSRGFSGGNVIAWVCQRSECRFAKI